MRQTGKIYLFLFPSYNKRKRTGSDCTEHSGGTASGKEEQMEEILIIDRNAVYELDEECLKKKMEAEENKQEEAKKTEESGQKDE